MKNKYAVTIEDLMVTEPKKPNQWMMEEFNNAFVNIWRSIKIGHFVRQAFQSGV